MAAINAPLTTFLRPEIRHGLRLVHSRVELQSDKPENVCERILARLEKLEAKEQDAWFKTDYRISWITVKWAFEGLPKNSKKVYDPSPFAAATRIVLHCHPDDVWPLITKTRLAKLGREYSDFYDEAGIFRPDRLDIPDYDPTCGKAYPVPASPAREPWPAPKRWPKAPLRSVVSRMAVVEDERVLYHLEQLECGHTHSETLGANPYKRRRRCRLCARAEVNAEDVAKIRIRFA